MEKQQTQWQPEHLGQGWPNCALNCVWFEPSGERRTCGNRYTFICQKYLEEVFGTNDEPE